MLAYTRQTLTAANQVLYALPYRLVIGSTLLLVVHRKEERGQRAGVPHLYQRQTAPMLFSVGSLHDKSRQQAWCMGPTLLFLAKPATSFNQSYVLFRDTGIHYFFLSSIWDFLKRPAYYAAYLSNVYAYSLSFKTKRIARFLHHHF